MKKTKKEKKVLTNSEKILTVVFCLLVALVIVLSVLLITKKNTNYKDIKANMVIPVTEKKSVETFSVDISDLKIGGIEEYIFKVSNKRNKTINKEELNYNITLTTLEGVSLKLFKNDENVNLLENNNLSVKNQKLEGKKEMYDLYRLIIKTNKKPEKNSTISVEITS